MGMELYATCDTDGCCAKIKLPQASLYTRVDKRVKVLNSKGWEEITHKSRLKHFCHECVDLGKAIL